MINTNPTGRDTTEVAVQRLSQKLITKLNLQGSSRVFEDDSNNISAHDSVPRALSKLNAALTAFDLSNRQDAEPIDSSKSYSEGEIVYAEGASWRVAAGGADAGDLPSTHPDKFVSFQEGVTSIANKEAAYALTGVAAGTVYKTEDTGQIMEFIGTDETSIYDWKMDGVILVADNDDKILLTNLPDGQQVKIVGEGGRIEQLPPSPLPDIKRGFIVSSEGNPRSSTSDGGNSVSGAFFWHEADSQFVRDDDGTYNCYIYHDGSRWQIGYQSGFGFFQSATCASTVHPADATGWTAYDCGSGIGQGTIADDGLVKTRACEVYNSPAYESTGSTPWRTIKNTVYLTVAVHPFTYGLIFHGVSVSAGSTQGIGWVAVTEPLEQNSSGQFKVAGVNGDTSLTVAGDIQCITSGTQTILPDVFPSGALVTIDNS